jgi:uncharacterized protein (DUF433 family)
MATQKYRIVPAEDSEIHDEPHVEGRRITVRDVYARVVERGIAPERVSERFDLDIADVHEALAYYYSNPEAMQRAAERHDRAIEEAKRRSSLTPPDG